MRKMQHLVPLAFLGLAGCFVWGLRLQAQDPPDPDGYDCDSAQFAPDCDGPTNQGNYVKCDDYYMYTCVTNPIDNLCVQVEPFPNTPITLSNCVKYMNEPDCTGGVGGQPATVVINPTDCDDGP